MANPMLLYLTPSTCCCLSSQQGSRYLPCLPPTWSCWACSWPLISTSLLLVKFNQLNHLREHLLIGISHNFWIFRRCQLLVPTALSSRPFKSQPCSFLDLSSIDQLTYKCNNMRILMSIFPCHPELDPFQPLSDPHQTPGIHHHAVHHGDQSFIVLYLKKWLAF
jgi:hypothetical protein